MDKSECRPTSDDFIMIRALISSGKTVSSVCLTLDIKRNQFQNWTLRKPAFAAMVDQAREDGVDAIMQECLEIADDVSDDIYDNGSSRRPNPSAVNRARVRINARLRVAKYLSPMKFAEARDFIRLKELAKAMETSKPTQDTEPTARVKAARARVESHRLRQ